MASSLAHVSSTVEVRWSIGGEMEELVWPGGRSCQGENCNNWLLS